MRKSTINQLIKQQKTQIEKLNKRHDKIIKDIQTAEALIEDKLGAQLCHVSEELDSYNVGLERLMIAKHSSQGIRRANK